MEQGILFARSLRVQLRVLVALVQREIITRYGRQNIGFLWLFVEPMLFTGGVTLLWSATRSIHGSDLPIVAFAVTGYSTVLLWRNGSTRCCLAIPPNVGLLYHRNVRVFDIFLARLLLELGGATISFTVLTIAFSTFGWMPWPEDLGVTLAGWVLLCWFTIALGMTLGALTAYSEVIERLWHTLTYLFLPFSGLLYMLDWLPSKMQELALYVPIVSGVEMVREGFFGSLVKAHYDAGYLIACCMILTLIALVLVKDASRQVEME